jgi:hypothetical protein
LLFLIYNAHDKTNRELIGEVDARLTDIMMAPGQSISFKIYHKDKPGHVKGILKV